MKLGIFTDSHYSSQEVTCGVRFNSKSLEKIRRAYEFFESEKCGLVVCLGDLIGNEDSREKDAENLRAVSEVICASSVPTVCVLGNHDAFAFTEAEFYGILGIAKTSSVEKEGKKLIFLDACYSKNGERYVPGIQDWTDTYYPFEEELKKTLKEAPGEVYVFIHQNLDPEVPENHRLFNADRVNALLLESGKVRTVYQGHYHHGNRSVHNGIRYVTFPAMCESDGAYFIEEI